MAENNPILDAAEVAAVGAGALVGGPAGAGLGVIAVLTNKLAAPLSRYRQARQEKFLEGVCRYLEQNDTEGAARIVEENGNTEQFADALDRGYEKMRRAFDPVAEECICLLVADHILSGQSTQRHFIQAGDLLERADAEILSTVSAICEAYLSGASAFGPGTGSVLFAGSRENAPEPEPRPFFYVCTYNGHRGTFNASDDMRSPKNLDTALVQLGIHGFGATWEGLGMSPPPERGRNHVSSRHRVRTSDHIAMTCLHRCLAPARRSAP